MCICLHLHQLRDVDTSVMRNCTQLGIWVTQGEGEGEERGALDIQMLLSVN